MPLEYSAISFFGLDCELEQVQQLARALGGHAAVQGVHAPDELEELAAGEAVEQNGFVWDDADSALDLDGPRGHGEAQDLDGSGGGRRQAHQHADGGGLAGAVGSQETEEAAARDRQGEAIDGGLLAVDLAQLADRDSRRRLGHRFHGNPRSG